MSKNHSSFFYLIDSKIELLAKIKNQTFLNQVNNAIDMFEKSLSNQGKIFICGNGGSAADAQHMAAELVGKFMKIRRAIPAIAITTDSSVLTSLGNDLSFQKIFSRQLEALMGKKDILLAITTSGKSKNIIEAIKYAKKNKSKVICLTSKTAPHSLNKICDLVLRVPAIRVDRIQELHLFIEHYICQKLEISSG